MALLIWEGSIALHNRRVKHEEAQMFPFSSGGALVVFDDSNTAFKLLSATPQFSIQMRVLWKALFEPLRCLKEQVISRVEILAIPIGSYSIELLRNPPAPEKTRRSCIRCKCYDIWQDVNNG